MNAEEQLLARKAIQYLKDHGLTICDGWKINGKPPEDIKTYLDDTVECCFPADEDELAAQVIEMIKEKIRWDV